MDDGEPFVALVIYPTTPEAQQRQAANLARLAREAASGLPGFVRARVFVSEDGGSLVSLTEWTDRDSFQQFRQTEVGRITVELGAGLHPKSWWLRPHAAVEHA